MENREHHLDCPVCGSAAIKPALSTKDYTVSGEEFAIWHCQTCTVRFTQDIPSPETIGQYYKSDDYISHSETKKGVINTLYHLVRKITLRSKRLLIENTVNRTKGSLLDIGCGTGSFIHSMQKAGWQVRGLEPDEKARAKGRELYGLNIESISVLQELPPHSFDVITLWHVLEHVHELHYYIYQLRSLLKKGGRLIIAVPNYTSYDAGYYGTYWAAYDVPRHLYHFSPKSMIILAEQHDFSLEQIQPMWFDSYYVSMLSEKYKNGKNNILRAFITGVVSNLKALWAKQRCSSLIYIFS